MIKLNKMEINHESVASLLYISGKACTQHVVWRLMKNKCQCIFPIKHFTSDKHVNTMKIINLLYTKVRIVTWDSNLCENTPFMFIQDIKANTTHTLTKSQNNSLSPPAPYVMFTLWPSFHYGWKYFFLTYYVNFWFPSVYQTVSRTHCANEIIQK